MSIRKIITALMLFTIFNFFGQGGEFTKIGYLEGDKYIITADTIRIKEYWQKIITITEININKFEIRKFKSWGDIQEDIYALTAYDTEKMFKMVRYLVNKNDSFYLFQHNNTFEHNEIFYCSYFYCFGTDTDCFPEIAFFDEEYFWTSKKSLVCETDNICKSGTIFVPKE